jgi:hypothetical protein
MTLMRFGFLMTVVASVVTPSPAVADPVCMTLTWAGNGPASRAVRAWWEHFNTHTGKATLNYDRDGGSMTFEVIKRRDGRIELTGSWSQRGTSGGYAYLMMDADGQGGAGYWSYAGNSARYELGIRIGGARCPGAKASSPARDPSCGIPAGGAVYPGCGHIYQSSANRQKQCGATDPPLKLVWRDGARSSCGIRRGQTVWSGCGYIYQHQGEWRAQCGQDGTAFRFVPRE